MSPPVRGNPVLDKLIAAHCHIAIKSIGVVLASVNDHDTLNNMDKSTLEAIDTLLIIGLNGSTVDEMQRVHTWIQARIAQGNQD